MNISLGTARAIVVDDQFHEVKPVFEALGKMKIGAVYLDGQIGSPEGFTGIRLAFVDMNLQPGDMSEKDHAKYTADYLINSLSGNSGPIAVFVWTGNTDAFSVFKEEFIKRKSDMVPVCMELMLKPNFESDVDKIVAKVKEVLSSQTGLKILWEWEQLIHDTATYSTTTLSRVIGSNEVAIDASTWSTSALKMFGELSDAAREKKIKPDDISAEIALSDFIAAMSAIYSDMMLRNKVTLISRFSGDENTSLVKARKKEIGGSIDHIQKARLSSLMHLSVADENGKGLPGTAYKVELIGDYSLNKITGLEESEFAKKFIKDKSTDTHSLLIDINQACDVAQDKVGMPRFLVGFLAKEIDGTEDIFKVMNSTRNDRGDSRWRGCGPIYLGKDITNEIPEGIYNLGIDVGFLISVQERIVNNLKPLFRLRREALVDVQSLLARHVARTGILSIY